MNPLEHLIERQKWAHQIIQEQAAKLASGAKTFELPDDITLTAEHKAAIDFVRAKAKEHLHAYKESSELRDLIASLAKEAAGRDVEWTLIQPGERTRDDPFGTIGYIGFTERN